MYKKYDVMMIPAGCKGHTTHQENLFNLNILKNEVSFQKVVECQNSDNLLGSSKNSMLYLFYHTLYYNYILRPKSTFCTLGEKPTFYPEITKNLMLEKCEFCGK